MSKRETSSPTAIAAASKARSEHEARVVGRLVAAAAARPEIGDRLPAPQPRPHGVIAATERAEPSERYRDIVLVNAADVQARLTVFMYSPELARRLRVRRTKPRRGEPEQRDPGLERHEA